MKLIPARELLEAMHPHRHDGKFHHETNGIRYYLCSKCGKVFSVVK